MGSNGTATVAAVGGTGASTYLWNTNPPQTTATATGLAAGYVVVTVTNGSCQLIDTIFVPNPAGLGEMSGMNLSVYPNPAGDELYVHVGGNVPSNAFIQIMDMSGRLMMVQDVLANKINTSSLGNGLYIIKINTENGTCMSKVLIQH
jgi:hypothetical protein